MREVLLASGRWRAAAWTWRRTVPTAVNDMAPDVSRAEAQKPWWTVIKFFASSLIYQAAPIIRFCKHDNRMVPSEMNREMTIQRVTGLAWIPAPGTPSSTHFLKEGKFPFTGSNPPIDEVFLSF